MKRLANPKDGGQYSFYYTVIKGWNAVRERQGEVDLGHRDAERLDDRLPPDEADRRLPPPHVDAGDGADSGGGRRSASKGKPGDYGRDVVSTGPYMIQGADKVSIASCSALKPMSGYDGANGNHIILVRNPNYDQSTDPTGRTTSTRSSSSSNSNADDIFAKVQSGAYQDEVSSPAPKTIRLYATNSGAEAADDPERRRPHLVPVTMNLTQPPFDDIHVRKAMNWIMDKAALQKAWGGPIAGLDRERTSSRRCSTTTASPSTTRTRRPTTTGSVEQGAGRDEAVEVRPGQDRQVHGASRARAS